MELYLSFSGQNIIVSNANQAMEKICKRYMIPCQADSQVDHVYVQMTKEDRIKPGVTLPARIAEALISRDMLFMHGAVVAKAGQGYMLMAPSGTGKTTRAQKWMEVFPDAYVVNGDKPFIRLTEKEALACGTPWCGKENLGRNETVPLKAIYWIEWDEDGAGTLVERMKRHESYGKLFGQIYHPEMQTNAIRAAQLLLKLVNRVEVFRFRSKPTCEGVRMAYEMAWRDPSERQEV